MPTFPLLRNPAGYRPCIQDLLSDADGREYWLALFERHVETLGDLPVAGAMFRDQREWGAFHADYREGLRQIRRHPDLRGELTVLELTKYRDEVLQRFNHPDPFHDLKVRENDVAFGEFADVLADLDRREDGEIPELLARGLFAGNLFDMGSKAAVDAFADKDHGFLEARRRVRDRPWPFDGLDAWATRLRDGARPYQKAIIFVDNAGPDIVLGVLPFVRDLARCGVEIVLAANSEPALNDVTAEELRPVLERAGELDASMRSMVRAGQIRVVASGCTSPLIDLSDLARDCCEEAASADLVVLEGMGRAIESNFDAEFTIDTLKIALIKDVAVAGLIGVRLFDPIFAFATTG